MVWGWPLLSRPAKGVRYEVESLRTGHWHPLVRQESGIDPWRNRRDTRQLAVDSDLSLAEVCVAASVDFIDAGQIVRKTGIPLLVRGLALGDHVQIGLLSVGRKRKRSRVWVGVRRQRGRHVDASTSVRLRQRKPLVGCSVASLIAV